MKIQLRVYSIIKQYLSKCSKKERMMIIIGVLILILITIFLIKYIITNRHTVKHPIRISVAIAPVTRQNIPVYINALGTVTPFETITVKTQINGQLQQVYFIEGQTVRKGDLLAQIDPQPYLAQLIQYEGQLARDKALLANALIDLARYKKLFEQDSISKQTLDTQVSLVEQYEGTVKSDIGQIESTKVNLSYCKIVSPIQGRVGLRQVDPGNFIQTTDPNGLVIINSIQPISVLFSVPEDHVSKINQKMNNKIKLVVDAFDHAQAHQLATGTLLTMNNQIDLTTGTVKLRALFQNKDNGLFPNQFVNVKLKINTLNNATVIPKAAVQQGVQGTFVYVVNDETMQVNIKPVAIQETVDDIVAILSDLKVNQKVVIEGADKLREGVHINIQQSG
ncbi:MAG: efflux RND transporter periplasmic adaptor subunit [Gammaproteobacteria bacterium]